MNHNSVWGLEGNRTFLPDQPIAIDQPPYLTNNWRALLADNTDYRYQQVKHFIRACNGVVTLFNGKVLLRSPLNICDGFFTLNEDNYIIQVDPSTELGYGRRYEIPDVEALRPKFEILDHSAPIYQQEIMGLIEFLNYVRSLSTYRSRARVHLLDQCFYSCEDKNTWFKTSIQLPFGGDGVLCDSYSLKMILTEMLRYDYIIFGKDNIYKRESPVVIGRDWSRCALCYHEHI